ncbi:DUF4232 domain-containing protein [Streptomyces physcomitrii]|uniref:DUF4232 domain-containing protein n=1 Tax=Streptomyces physcomitrii TaxID=2724184 RepID=A0ABX1H3I9_9ACTN|nr:DUF4232 domain-containing protein [Streptomyces physcomitrii]NKI41875.1 DUF4232 domain-containing protein [Streptomyces physcomitrii]
MSGIRSSRVRLLTAASAVALTALSLTACEDGTGTRDEGASASVASGASGGQTPGATPSTGPSAGSDKISSGTDDESSGTGGSGGAPAAPEKTGQAPAGAGGGKGSGTCTGSNTRTVATQVSRPLNRMLLTVTNTGKSTCYLYYYPAVKFGAAQSVPPAVEETKPQAVVTLGPGESGYAGVNLSAADGSGGKGHTAKSLTVYFTGRSGQGSTGAGAHPALPAKGVHVDDSVKVTYWQQSLGDALEW